MKLYEITEAVENAIKSSIDQETGEIIDELAYGHIEQLELNKEVKCLDVACVIKEKLYEEKAIKEEIAKLKKRQDTVARQREWLINYLQQNIAEGEKHKDVRASISWRKSSMVMIDIETENLPDDFQRVSIQPDKTALKKHLESGNEIEGVWIKSNLSLQIK